MAAKSVKYKEAVMIRNIVFDMGNVLIHWYPDIFVERLELPEEDQQQLKQEVYGREEWTLLDQGMIESEEAIAAMWAWQN